MTGRALITGASSGIGAELARLHAARGGDLVLVARRAEALGALQAELEAEHGVTVEVIPADLTGPGAPEAVHAAAPGIDILINNAGFGALGPFHAQDLATHRQMIALNIEALTALAHLYLPDMIARGQGRVLNVSSTASFLPGPQMAVYFASKAYVTSLSLALAEEARGTGVTVTALCPGPVKTEFAEVANMQGLKLIEQGITPDRTARAGYEAMMRGRLVAFDDWRLRLALGWIVPLLPRSWVLRASQLSMSKA